jgi:hypothetical protein
VLGGRCLIKLRVARHDQGLAEPADCLEDPCESDWSTCVIASPSSVLSVNTGGGKSVEIAVHADPLYQHLLLTAERKFWRCVQTGEPPRLFGVEPPRPRIQLVRIVDMSSSNSWAEFASVFRRTGDAYLEHENARAELKRSSAMYSANGRARPPST